MVKIDIKTRCLGFSLRKSTRRNLDLDRPNTAGDVSLDDTDDYETDNEALIEAVDETDDEALIEAAVLDEASIEAVDEPDDEALIEAVDETVDEAPIEADDEAPNELPIDSEQSSRGKFNPARSI